MHLTVDPEKEISELFDELDTLLKNPDVTASLTSRGINASLALLIADGLRSYLLGKKKEAAEDLATAAEEIASRLVASASATETERDAPSKGS
jgi:CHASE3 domain sensor protein